MGSRSLESGGDSGSSTGADDGSRAPVASTVDEEVTRVEGVSYLEGASGHGVLSLVFLVVALLFVRVGMERASVVSVIVAYGVALNGLSIYAWDRLRAYAASVVDRGEDTGPARTLTPHRLSTEMKAELFAGFAMVGGFVVALGVAMAVVRLVGPSVAIYLAVGALALGDIGALGWTYYA